MVLLLDTNVVSELVRKSPDPAVGAWAAGHPPGGPVLLGSRRSGVALRRGHLADGRRRETLVSDIERMLHDAFEGRVLPFDSDAARA